MGYLVINELPFRFQLQFSEIIEELSNRSTLRKDELEILSLVKETPQFTNGFDSTEEIATYSHLIHRLFESYFPESFSQNEIKALTLPYWDHIFNSTARLQKIIAGAGNGFKISIRDFNYHQGYILSCCIILDKFYQTKIDFTKPLFLDIPATDGSLKHFRLLYNADYLHIRPAEEAPVFTPDDIKRLLDNYEDLEFWQQMFPPGSWIFYGFAIMNLFDATVENAISSLSANVFQRTVKDINLTLLPVFQAIYKSKDIHVGLMFWDTAAGSFMTESSSGLVNSYLIGAFENARDKLLPNFYRKLIESNTYLSIADVEMHRTNNYDVLVDHLYQQGIKSVIVAPVKKNGKLIAVLEIVSDTVSELHSVNAQKLNILMPSLTDLIDKLVADHENEIQAVIQQNYTGIHPSVEWRFREEARKAIQADQRGESYVPEKITFNDVYPLYGQTDIKGSTVRRNECIREDLQRQLQTVIALCENIDDKGPVKDFDKELHKLRDFQKMLDSGMQAGLEQQIADHLDGVVHYKLEKLKISKFKNRINSYFKANNRAEGKFYKNRRKYEETVNTINQHLAGYTDEMQKDAQEILPHFFERFKSDGVEHNLYVGRSVSNGRFRYQHLEEMRFWQLRLLAILQQRHYDIAKDLPIRFEVTSLILVYHSPISITFRMDEKRFDVDGAYNARFEIIKKRIDKALIKDTGQRITETGKIVIVYSSDAEGTAYSRYIRSLQKEGLLGNDVRCFDVQDLQGVSGLKALQVEVKKSKRFLC